LTVVLRLSKAGYGAPDALLAMRTDLVMAALEYEVFLKDYEAEFAELNRPENK
jgi:hypothetical protein